MQQTMGV